MGTTVVANDVDAHSPETIPAALDEIGGRLSQELVIAMVGPIRSGVTTTAAFIRDNLIGKFGYTAEPIIKISAIIDEDAHSVGLESSRNMPFNERVAHLQKTGNALRREYGPDYLAKRAVEVINRARTRSADQGLEAVAEGAPRRSANLRRVSVIDSLKNEAELSLLRTVYRDVLVVFGVFAPDHVRERRLKDEGLPDSVLGALLDTDQGEVIPHGQQTRSIFSEADFFIRNDGENRTGLERSIRRFLDVVFDIDIHTPTRAEAAMHEADAVSHRSACMSRQVGAAIVDKNGDLISVGWNDVPKHGGGLYGEDEQWSAGGDRDNRCFRFGRKICHNDNEKELIRAELVHSLKKANVLRDGTTDAEVTAAVQGTRLDAVIEFSRAIHAEMEAVLAVARDSRHSLVGATLYSTVYPCHNCARHIVAAGIEQVVYIQPYRKSLAIKLHHDAVSEDAREPDHTTFVQYEGVAPKHFSRLFRSSSGRKENGVVRTADPVTASPAFRQPLDGFTNYELLVVQELGSITNDGR